MNEGKSVNHETFRDLVFAAVVEKSPSPIKDGKHGPGSRRQAPIEAATPDANVFELDDFAEYLALEIFTSLPESLQLLSYQALQTDGVLAEKLSLPLEQALAEDLCSHVPGDVVDSLAAYGLIEPPRSDLQSFLTPVLSAYIAMVTASPPKWSETRASACEICERDWIPVTYHHLIPKQVHAKVLKRGWHDEHELNKVAWLCRACHSFVHRMASNEELAREWHSVALICQRDDVQKWARWVRRVRWKKT